MCGFGTSSKILRGLNTLRFFSLLLTFLTILISDIRGTILSSFEGKTGTERLYGTREGVERVKSRMDIFDNENVLMGHSGDPWGLHEESDDLRNSKIRSSASSSNGKARNSSNVGVSSRRRLKRSVVHLYNMVVCATGCNPVSYKGYGCYCGFLGSGTAVDGIDRCCRMHDRCYDATECPTFLEYFVPYYWKCYRGYKPICAVEHGKWGGSGSCAQRLCECDRALSECLRRFPCPTSKAVCTTSPWRLIQNVFMIF